ncbi:acyl-CoA dehydrogenase family protein [Micromonospora carbonacea]|uniref:acyl-CoA dehydrogenase family protein n=1 Tax=Micromonospora carbonacea TaxID=47853 RepID=UPI003D98A166
MTRTGTALGAAWPSMLAVAHASGWSAALTALHAAVDPGVVVLGPAGHGLVPDELAATADRLRQGEWEWAPADTVERLDTGVPGLTGLRARRPVTAVRVPEARSWTTALAGLRLGLSYRLLEGALRYLDRRYTGNVVLLQHSVVKSAVADVVMEQLQVRCALDGAGPDGLDAPAVADLHAQITAVDRAGVRLLGAHGYVEGGPGSTVYVSELLADAYRAGTGSMPGGFDE